MGRQWKALDFVECHGKNMEGFEQCSDESPLTLWKDYAGYYMQKMSYWGARISTGNGRGDEKKLDLKYVFYGRADMVSYPMGWAVQELEKMPQPNWAVIQPPKE